MPFQTALQQLKVPVRCTSSTLAKSAGSILLNDLSRRMPALAQSRSTPPHSLVARSTIAVTCAKFETSAPSAIATPPAFLISSTTVCAGVSDPPLPSRAPPKSFTTTLEPRLAKPSACARPRPLPAPVTIATRPSNLIVMCVIPSFFFRHARPCAGHPRLFNCHIKQDVDDRTSPIQSETGSSRPWLEVLSKIDQPDPISHQRRLVLAFNFDG